uniref:Uncharacterized protein n=1 Tax=Plectus sambesii TaxID=2011161 RepID=A0A914UMM4_9BILA
MEKKGFLPYDEKILNLLNGPSTDESTSTPVFSTPAILTETVAIDEEESPLMVTGGLRVKSFTIRRSQPQPVLKDTQVETTYRQEKMVQLKHELDYETRKYPEFVDSSNYLFATTQENVAFIKDGIEHDSVTHQEVVHSARESETVDNSGYAVTSAPLFLRTSSNLPPRNFNDQSDGRVVTLGEWMEWSGCEGSSAGQRKRYIACEAEKFELCPYETEPCEKTGKLTLQKDDVELLSMNMMHDQPIEPTGAVSSSKSSTLATDLSEGSKSEADEFAGPCLPFNGDCRVGVRLLKSGAKQYCLDVDAKLCT